MDNEVEAYVKGDEIDMQGYLSNVLNNTAKLGLDENGRMYGSSVTNTINRIVVFYPTKET